MGNHSLGACLEEALGIELRRRVRSKARWGWEGTGFPESIAVFTLISALLREPLSESRALSLDLLGGTPPKLTSIHLLYLGC